jgi:hypothetical protein
LLRDEGLWEEWVSTFERSGEHTFEWYGPVVETTWEAGPFSFPVAELRHVEERHGGDVTVHSVGGATRVVYGPWRVVIRGLGARAERRILAVWKAYRSWEAQGGAATETTTLLARSAPSGSGYWCSARASEGGSRRAMLYLAPKERMYSAPASTFGRCERRSASLIDDPGAAATSAPGSGDDA